MLSYYKMNIVWIGLIVLTYILVHYCYKHDQYHAPSPHVNPFGNVWNMNSKNQVEKQLLALSNIFKSLDIPWFVAYGTLLGAIRHQNIIPWDDDVDIFVGNKLVTQIDKFKNKITEAGLKISQSCGVVPYKIYHPDGMNIPGSEWKWPFVDIFLFDDLAVEEIILSDTVKKITINRDDVFPLKEGILGALKVPVPRNSLLIIAKEYTNKALSECVSTSWNHRKEEPNLITYSASFKSIESPNLNILDIPAFIINLDRRPDRIRAANLELSKIGLKTRRISAIDAKDPNFIDFYKKINTSKRKIHEIACALSHIETLKTFLSTNSQYALIFEDDIHFPKETTIDTINKAFNNSKGMKLLLLGHCSESPNFPTDRGDVYIGSSMCLHAYVVSRQGAKDIILTYRFDEPIDITTKKLRDRTGGLTYVAGSPERYGGRGLVMQTGEDTDIITRGLD